MGSLTLQYPPMTGGDAAQQLDGLRRYLVQLTDELNGADWSAGAVLTQISQAIDASALSKEERLTELRNLYDRRLITEEEYEAKRKEILDKL